MMSDEETLSICDEDAGASTTLKRRVELEGGTLKMTLSAVPTELPDNLVETKPSGSSINTISIRANAIEELEEYYLEHRTEVVQADGFLSTPLHVLKIMAEEFDIRIHSEYFMINYSLNGEKIFRVELLVGHFRGIGQSPKRKLSFQMAAVDLLEKVKSRNSDIKLRRYALFPGMRINSNVYHDLNELCMTNNLSYPRFSVKSSAYEDGPMFTVECCIGRLSVFEKSDDRAMAKRLAAKKMYEQLACKSYPTMDCAYGSQCIGFRELSAFGVQALTSPWKKEWLLGNRVGDDGKSVLPEDEPDDGDFDLGGVEDLIEELTLSDSEEMPRQGQLSGLTRVILNETATGLSETVSETVSETASNMDMDN